MKFTELGKADSKYQLEVDSDAADAAKESGQGNVEKQTETRPAQMNAEWTARVNLMENAAHKKEPDRQVRQEPLLAQETALPGSNEENGSQMGESAQEDTLQPSTVSSDLTITEFYQPVKADPDFTKYFSDDVVRKAEGLDRMREEETELRHRPRRARSLRRGHPLCPGRLVLFHSVGNAAVLWSDKKPNKKKSYESHAF